MRPDGSTCPIEQTYAQIRNEDDTVTGVDPHVPRHQSAKSRRGRAPGSAAATAGGARGGRRGEPVEGRIPRHGLARVAHADDRDHRLDGAADGRPAGRRAPHEALAALERSARAQAAVVNDLLDTSLIVRGALRLDVRRTNLAQGAHRSRRNRGTAGRGQEDHPAPRGGDDVSTIDGDPDRLRQVFWNLLSNAVKFTPEGGSIEVSAQRAGRRGAGGCQRQRLRHRSGLRAVRLRSVPPGERVVVAALRRSRSWPGDRARAGRAPRWQHRGGQRRPRTRVALHRPAASGRSAAGERRDARAFRESGAEPSRDQRTAGRPTSDDTTATLEAIARMTNLPFAARAARRASPQRSSGSARRRSCSSSRTIPRSGRCWRCCFGWKCYDVVECPRTALQALALMRQRLPCAVLLDLMMPVMDGWEFRRHQLRGSGAGAVPVLCITAVPNPVEVGARLGVPCLPKPLDSSRLLFEVQERCGRPAG